ncbi:hypothetical protein TNCV_768241 [Trichonephila clavipes]|nr:hypothetical protein TNCV_768241 [Trichonephila clavipes]
MFSVPIPISPLRTTPVASPSHEPSQDAIYDTLPPMEQSTVPELPLKDLLPQERRTEERRNEERRPRDPRMYRRPDFRPPYRRHDFKPRELRRLPYAQQLMPTSHENAQVFFHSQGLAVLCIRTDGFMLTNGVVSYAMDWECPNKLFKFLHYLYVGTICVTDQHSKQKFKEIQTSWSSPQVNSSEPCNDFKFKWTRAGAMSVL